MALCLLMTLLPVAALAEDSTAVPPPALAAPAEDWTGAVPPVEEEPGAVSPVDQAPGQVPPVEEEPGAVPPVDQAPGQVPPVEEEPDAAPPVDGETDEPPAVEEAPGGVPPVEMAPAEFPAVEEETSQVPPAGSGAPQAAPAVDMVLPESVGTFTVTYTMADGLEEYFSFHRGQPGPVTANTYSCGETVNSFGVFLRDLETKEYEKAVVMTLLSDVTGYEKNSKVERTYAAGTVVSAFDGTDAKVKYGGYSPDGGGFGFTSFPDGIEVEIELSLVYPRTPETGGLTVLVMAAGVAQLPQAYEAVLTVACAASETVETYTLSAWTPAETRGEAAWAATCAVEDLRSGDYQVTLTGASSVEGYQDPALAQTQTLTVTAAQPATTILHAVYRPAAPGGEPTQPGGEPTQPGGEPTQPGGEPTQPGGEPTQPGGEPTQPGGEPTQPGGEPTRPGGEPTQPGGEPTQPEGEADRPDDEADRPEEPTQAPSAPAETVDLPPEVGILDMAVPQTGRLDTVTSLDALTEITDQAPPLAALPETGGQGAEVVIDPTELPLGDLPQTGTQAGANPAALGLAGLLCLLGGAGGLLLGRKKEV